MDFLKKLGFSEETIDLVRDVVVQNKKGEIFFPFSFLRQHTKNSGELLFIDRKVIRSNDGLFLIEPEKDSIKLNTYYFDTVLSMLCFYEYNNKNLFQNSLFIVIPIVPQFNSISILIDKFKYSIKNTFVFPNDLTGSCQEILLASYINANYELSIKIHEENLVVSKQKIIFSYPLNKLNIKQVLSDLNFGTNITTRKPKGFKSYTNKFYYNGK